MPPRLLITSVASPGVGRPTPTSAACRGTSIPRANRFSRENPSIRCHRPGEARFSPGDRQVRTAMAGSKSHRLGSDRTIEAKIVGEVGSDPKSGLENAPAVGSDPKSGLENAPAVGSDPMSGPAERSRLGSDPNRFESSCWRRGLAGYAKPRLEGRHMLRGVIAPNEAGDPAKVGMALEQKRP